MTKIFFGLGIVLMVFAACRTTKVVNIPKDNRSILIAPGRDGSLVITLSTPTHLESEKGEVDLSLSYAVDQRGKRYNLVVEKNTWAREKYKSVSRRTPPDFFWLANDGNSVRKSWSNGTWDLRMVLKTSSGSSIYSTIFELGTQSVLITARPN